VIRLYNGDCLEILKNIDTKNKILVIDPPFNVGYHYNTYKDKMKPDEYLEWLGKILKQFESFVIIHYPEDIFKIASYIDQVPTKVVSWVYNSCIPKQHRMIAYFNVKPDFSKVKQPYKNPNDKRIKAKIAAGSKGCKLYDWWNINQVKNVSKEKTEHPCQMPLEVMERIIGILPDNVTIVDCFMGSGTTGVACKHYDIDFIGIELDEKYFNIAKGRINEIENAVKKEVRVLWYKQQKLVEK